MRWARTIWRLGDQPKTVKRPSCEATRAKASCWSWANWAAERWRVPPSWVGWTICSSEPSMSSEAAT